MIYIYDILLNWTDPNCYYEFYEWEKKDQIDHVKRMPLLKVEKDTLTDFFYHDIKVEDVLLEKIEGLTEVYRNKKIETIPYACLICDGARALAVHFSEDGTLIAHSKMILDEEEDVIDLVSKIEFFSFDYKKGKKCSKDAFYTRKEQEKRIYLIGEFDYAYHKKDKEKLSYLYQEYFNDLLDNIEEMYQKLRDSLEDFTENHDDLYQLLKLSHQKKSV